MVLLDGDGAVAARRIVERRPIPQHEGASGAVLESAVLDDGSQLVLKTFDPDRDLSMVLAGRAVPTDVELWQSGILDRLPPQLGHAVRGAWQEDGRWVLAMHDLSGTLLSYESRLTREAYRTVIGAAAALHASSSDIKVDSLWSAEARVSLFAPRVMSPHEHGENPLPGWCLQGWAAWAELAPADVRALVDRIHADPRILTRPLRRLGPMALLHGDFWTPNLALDEGRVVAIDWALATIGPPVLEYVSFLVGCSGQVEATRDDLVSDLRDLLGPGQEELLQVGLVFGVVELGWNLAWQLAHHPSPQTSAEFDWWVHAARAAANAGCFD
ncbi:MAG: phosphotransferase [Micropruina sp.]